MKAIMVMYDSLNRHFLPPYGNDWVKAPNFRRLAEHTVTFDNNFVGSLPCMPARRELHTGRYNFLHRSWGPLEPYDDSMPEILRNNGVYTHLVSDHQHYWEDGGATYHHRYCTWENVRGQEGDRWKGIVDPEAHGIDMKSGRNSLFLGWQDRINRYYMDTEDKQPQAQTVSLGLHFLEKNWEADNWFLQIETFDPHEPFFTKNRYKELYPHDYDGEDYDWPGFSSEGDTPEQVEHLKYEYAASVSMCDNYLGNVLDFMDAHDMWKDTMLIVNTDHGYMLGERGVYGKGSHPGYNLYANTPLFIWDPRSGIRNEHRDQLATTIDLPATLLEYFGVERPKDMLGQPLRPVIEQQEAVHDGILFGAFGNVVNVCDGRYVYMHPAPEETNNAPLYEYVQMPTHMRSLFSPQEMEGIDMAPPFSFTKNTPLMRFDRSRVGANFGGVGNMSSRPGNVMQLYAMMGLGKGFAGMRTAKRDTTTYLFDLQNDPEQLHPIHDPEIEDRMKRLMVRIMKENDAPVEQYTRLGLEAYL